jgi:hypothetical protein
MMKKWVSILLIFILGGYLASGLCLPAHASSPDKRVKMVKTAMLRWLSMEYYWLGGWIGPRMSVPVRVKFEVLTDVEVSPKTRMFGYYWGRIKNRKAAIIMCEGYVAPLDGSDNERLFEKRTKVFESGRVFDYRLVMPPELTPRYDLPSKQKERMLDAIISTMRQAGAASADSELLIGSFNVDYPYAYVMVPSQDIYVLTLHDFQDYENDEYGKESYAWNSIDDENSLKILRPKIRLHSIVRKLTLETHKHNAAEGKTNHWGQ